MKKQPFTILPNFIYDAVRAYQNISSLEKLLLFDILRYTEGYRIVRKDIFGAWIKSGELAKWHGVAKGTVQKALRNLRLKKVIICGRTSNYGTLIRINKAFKDWEGWKDEWTARVYPPKKQNGKSSSKTTTLNIICKEALDKYYEEVANADIL